MVWDHFLEKRVFDPFSTHFWSRNGPFSRHFRIFHGPKRATMASKRPKNTCLSIPSGLGTTLEKKFFSPRGPWWTHRWHPPCAGWAAPSNHWYGGLGVSFVKSEAWKPQKVRGCGWTRCPYNLVFSHIAQYTARAWFRGVLWRSFGSFLGDIFWS